ncbi:hypothetical protein SUGI_0009730 [Cryptomeria japonica]|nr:hypothetical protein SUGI_0009730 [Cryptomeria japonica]
MIRNSLSCLSQRKVSSPLVTTKAMAAAWVLLVIFMVLICVTESEGEEYKTVARLSSTLLNSSGWKPNENMYLVSSNGMFCAGFYNVRANRYAFAVWYANDSHRTMAWMANSTSLVGRNSSLHLRDGFLSISDENGVIAWMSKDTYDSKYISELTLQESGNMVLNGWQSFREFPTFNLLPKQDFTTEDVLLSRSPNGTYGRDGNYYSLSLEQQSSKLSLYYNYRRADGVWESKMYWQSGRFLEVKLDESGFLNTTEIDMGFMIMATDGGEEDRLRRLTLESNGNLVMYSRTKYPPPSSWTVAWQALPRHCQIPGACGDNAVCKINLKWEPTCECPPGFDPSPVDNRSCKPHNDITKLSNVTFVPLDFVSFEALTFTTQTTTILQECMDFCRNNSSCVGFTHHVDSGNCDHLFGNLIYGYWSQAVATRLYLKISASEEDTPNLFHGLPSVLENVCPILLKLPLPPSQSDHKPRNLIIIFFIFGLELLLGAYAFRAFLRKYSKFRDMARIFALDLLPSGGPKQFSEFYFPEWAFEMVMIKRKMEEVVDKRLNEIKENQSEMEAVQRMVKTALWCIQSRPEERPSMGKVAKMLEGAIEIEDPPKPSLLEDSGAGPRSPISTGMKSSIKSSGRSHF